MTNLSIDFSLDEYAFGLLPSVAVLTETILGGACSQRPPIKSEGKI